MAATSFIFSCSLNVIHSCRKNDPSYPRSFLGIGHGILVQSIAKGNQNHHCYGKKKLSRGFTVYAVTKGSEKSSKSEETMPSWAKPDSDEPPPWARDEGKQDASLDGFEFPFFVYLLASAITAIAAVSPLYHIPFIITPLFLFMFL